MVGTGSNDRVMLYNIGLGQLVDAQIGTDYVTISTNVGQTLTVKGTAEVFTLGDGSSWRASHQARQWSAV